MISIERTQLEKLNLLLDGVWAGNPFYARTWRRHDVFPTQLSSLAEFASFPLIAREELLLDQTTTPPLGTNVTLPWGDLKRFHRSSGTTHAPMLWADSGESWQWVMRCSQRLWRLAGVGPSDRVLFLAPFGLSSGSWIIYEGACRLGCACLPVGQEPAPEKLWWLANFKPTVLAGKPSVLQALALNAKSSGASPRAWHVPKLILTGEYSPALAESLEKLWGAECFDRYGLTEAGSVASECTAHSGGLHLLDDEFIAECINPDTGEPLPDGESGELVLTNLGRLARPIIRYRTGDTVRLVRQRECACGLRGAMLLGGVDRRRAG